ncbi:MAG: hypothetical protein LUH20_04605 [Lachnospiraceae bacterium]|nr:hypothetical protein [Lachnospiraceae bacterium]
MNSVVMVGKYELLESNVVYLDPGMSEVVICFATEEEEQTYIHLSFTDDQENTEYSIKANVQNNHLYITCVNFCNTLGTGTVKALEIRSTEMEKILFHFWVYAVGEKGTRRIEYNLLKEAVND